ncbi:unnamed protein product [Paramecium primaurelia]|uniref:Casein kinase I n=1 Tax=Paramecium primaurelia TaxID=5886 RepID=A0A8S1QPU0_PARPR|nr:unnamed protein product [Paramecium primaurelia]
MAYQSQCNSQMNTNHSLKAPVDSLLGRVVCKNYLIVSKINEGSFGKVYKAIHQIKQDYYAVKIEAQEHRQKKGETLRLEAEILKKLNGEKGIPRLYYYIEDSTQRVLVETLLGKNLDELYSLCNHKFSLKTILLFMDQAISRLEYLHSQGYIHRDIKPENFMIGIPPNENLIYLIDFGLNAPIYDSQKKLLPKLKGQPLVGTARFTPICSHQGYSQSRASDLESLGYLAIFFLKGSLPWMKIEAQTKEERFYLIGQKKMRETPMSLCYGLPREFEGYFNYIFNVSHDTEPSYNYLRKLLKGLMHRMQYNDNIFDWQEIIKKEEESKKSSNKKIKLNAQTQQFKPIESEDEQDSPKVAMMQSKDSKKSSSNFLKRSITDQLNFQKQQSINQRNNIELLISQNELLNLRLKQKIFSNNNNNKNQEESENFGFGIMIEYYQYPTRQQQMDQLITIITKFIINQ